jgi:hypothetical protein
MILRQRLKDPRVLTFAAIPPNTFGDELLDGVAGLCMGIAIATLLLGVWRRGRRS